mmetsp:Transcript_11657/g.43829  ORF Transcript_11657/g.43829 Transcript_11657/m.43829 type:complete len:472 (+) Transcript_11657:636-2051(+)
MSRSSAQTTRGSQRIGKCLASILNLLCNLLSQNTLDLFHVPLLLASHLLHHLGDLLFGGLSLFSHDCLLFKLNLFHLLKLLCSLVLEVYPALLLFALKFLDTLQALNILLLFEHLQMSLLLSEESLTLILFLYRLHHLFSFLGLLNDSLGLESQLMLHALLCFAALQFAIHFLLLTLSQFASQLTLPLLEALLSFLLLFQNFLLSSLFNLFHSLLYLGNLLLLQFCLSFVFTNLACAFLFKFVELLLHLSLLLLEFTSFHLSNFLLLLFGLSETFLVLFALLFHLKSSLAFLFSNESQAFLLFAFSLTEFFSVFSFLFLLVLFETLVADLRLLTHDSSFFFSLTLHGQATLTFLLGNLLLAADSSLLSFLALKLCNALLLLSHGLTTFRILALSFASSFDFSLRFQLTLFAFALFGFMFLMNELSLQFSLDLFSNFLYLLVLHLFNEHIIRHEGGSSCMGSHGSSRTCWAV